MSATISSSDAPIYFWMDDEQPYGFLSQWYKSAFIAPSPIPNAPPMTFNTAEQYMMYHKATVFKDAETAEEIMQATKPRKQKALGRKVKGFDKDVWDKHKEIVVEEGNMNKFGHPKEDTGLKTKLLETGDRELVEASQFDRVWGVGFNRETADAHRSEWGENLLGKALMRVRSRLREQAQHL